MWFFEVKYENNCIVGGHFETSEEMVSWFKTMLSYYVNVDKAYDIKIWYEDNYDGGIIIC